MQTTGWDFGGMLPPPVHEQATVHERVQAGPEFAELRWRLRRLVFPMTAAFLLWYLAYVLLASYAREFMATPVSGGIKVGLLVGLAAVRVDVRAHRGLRAASPGAGSTRWPRRSAPGWRSRLAGRVIDDRRGARSAASG